MQRRRSVPHTFEDKIAAEKSRLELEWRKLKPGPSRDSLVEKMRQLDTASRLHRLLRSPEPMSQEKH